jgi:hypothetical protein
MLNRPGVLAVATDLAQQACERGARAVVLTGSHARGSAHPESDIDLHCIGTGPSYLLSRTQGFLVSESWRSADSHRAAFHDPGLAGGAVPGWRQALILCDPSGVARRLQDEARHWTWEVIGADTLDEWVADQVAGFAEEVHKLVIALERSRQLEAAVQRSILALRLALVMSVRQRMLYDTENQLWSSVSVALGEPWSVAQREAFALDGVDDLTASRGALMLYRIAASEAAPHCQQEQLDVIQHAVQLSERWLNPPH